MAEPKEKNTGLVEPVVANEAPWPNLKFANGEEVNKPSLDLDSDALLPPNATLAVVVADPVSAVSFLLDANASLPNANPEVVLDADAVPSGEMFVPSFVFTGFTCAPSKLKPVLLLVDSAAVLFGNDGAPPNVKP